MGIFFLKRKGILTMIEIRKYQPQDFLGVHQVSLSASSHPNKQGDDLKYHYLMYTDYYLTEQSDTTFVAVDEGNRVQGYLLCAKDCFSYVKTMSEEMIPTLNNEYLEKRANLECQMYLKYAKKYPAHLHIDVTPVCQGQKVGTRLMTALFVELKRQKVNGVMLGVSAKNLRAIDFYTKMGFQVLEENPYVKMMGYLINDFKEA